MLYELLIKTYGVVWRYEGGLCINFFVIYINVRDLCAALDTGFDNSSLSPKPRVYVA